jgi:hypothetical protein
MNAITAQRASLIRPWRAAAVALAIVASLWAGFGVGRISTPAAQNGAAIVQHERGFAGIPIVIPTGKPGRVWGHWDSAPVRIRSDATTSSADPIHSHPHHRVKWG